MENLFDTWDDSTCNDDAFTPEGDNHWSDKRYRTKLNGIFKTIAAIGQAGGQRDMMPMAIGLAEVENDKVLRDLCQGTPLRRQGYRFIHFDSPDLRGIDNALLYRPDIFTPFLSQAISVSDSIHHTRDILLVEGVTAQGDTLILLVNHFPSKLGGADAQERRMWIAAKLRAVMDTLQSNHPCAGIVVTGDFNASPSETEIYHHLVHNGNEAFVNLMELVAPGVGTHKYQGNWTCLDQIIVSRNLLADGDRRSGGMHALQSCLSVPHLLIDGGSAHIFDADFLLVDEEKNLGKKPFRTYIAMKYQGGYSDHLPVYVDLKRCGE